MVGSGLPFLKYSLIRNSQYINAPEEGGREGMGLKGLFLADPLPFAAC